MNFKNFDLNLLRVLDALLETGSTTGAGDRIGLSQPAVSAALGRLRHALDDPLFVRHGRRLVATEFADSLRDPLRALLAETELLLSGADRFDPLTATSAIRLSGSDFFSELLIPDLAEELSRTAPGITVQMVNLVPDSYIDTIEQYQIDIALIPEMNFPNWVAHQTLFRSSFSVITRRDHPAVHASATQPGTQLPLDLFCALPQVLFSPEGKLHGMGDAALDRIGRNRTVAMTLPVFSGVYNAVANSDLIALLPTSLALRVAPRVGLDLYTPPMPLEPATLCMAWHVRASNSPAHRWLRDQIARLVKPLDCGG